MQGFQLVRHSRTKQEKTDERVALREKFFNAFVDGAIVELQQSSKVHRCPWQLPLPVQHSIQDHQNKKSIHSQMDDSTEQDITNSFYFMPAAAGESRGQKGHQQEQLAATRAAGAGAPFRGSNSISHSKS